MISQTYVKGDGRPTQGVWPAVESGAEPVRGTAGDYERCRERVRNAPGTEISDFEQIVDNMGERRE